ncbi:MAG TPA: biotin--[acetyl-CoA-carboxylase] ligase [Acidimicrobiales bacterium]|nr:biotin--[acetyl-CoA-carboxylase] ligase [Acidimicrobiales bacterium]
MDIDERVRARLAAETRFRDVRWLAEVDSTNRVARDIGDPWTVVVADHQSAGRGRLGRSWEAPAGTALLLSVVLAPGGLPLQRVHLLTAAVGLAAADACAEVAGVRPALKWPNDLLVGDGKLAGILAELVTTEPLVVVVGMGLNLTAAPAGAACLSEGSPGLETTRDDVLLALLENLDRRLAGDWDGLAADYRQRCATVGREVRVEALDGTVRTGRAERIDRAGRIVVSFPPGGREEVIDAGDVHHLRVASGR